jgi:hypothetical protein
MIRRKSSIGAIQAAAMLGVIWGGLAPAQAHHASANFDNSKIYSFQMTVKKWMWANPHTWLYAVVIKPDGSQELWGFEGGGTNMLLRNGWSAADLKPGDKVTIYAMRDRSGIHIGELSKVVLANGQNRSLGPPLPLPGSSSAPGGAATLSTAPGGPLGNTDAIPYN